MDLFLLENRYFLGFRMIFKVWLNQIFSNFNTMLWTINIVLKFEKIWLSRTLNIIWKPRKSLFSKENVNFTIFELNLYFMVHCTSHCLIFSNFNTMLWTIKYRLNLITVYFTFTVPELWPFFS
jgi:hypothetical protein